MPRANSSVPRHRRHRKIVKQAKGYYGARSRNFKAAKDAVEKAGLSQLSEGQDISFEKSNNKGKTSAVNLKVE